MYALENLEEKTVAELKRIAFHEMKISGMSRSRKADLLDAILEYQEDDPTGPETPEGRSGPLDALDATLHTQVMRPNAEKGNRLTTTIQVSSGASTYRFNVIGKTCGAVADLLREALNISEFSSPIVNGAKVSDSYIIKEGDVLEYLKPAGEKGC